MDRVSETCRCAWAEVWRMPVLEFLTVLAYRKDKDERERRELEEWKRKH